jgi:hypothetical protein
VEKLGKNVGFETSTPNQVISIFVVTYFLIFSYFSLKYYTFLANPKISYR